MESKFQRFVNMFANYPKPKSNLSLSDKPAPKVQPHHPSRSQEGAQRLRNGNVAPTRPKDPGELDIFASPPKPENRRPRRSSESSMHEKSAADDERRRRERRHREREARHKDGRPRDSRPPKTKKPGGLDLIDKLDVTGIYGQGLFHHDGPFDACNPHRNRKKDSRAPMQAFPVGSANNALGGSGPVNKSINVDQFHGRGVEGFTDYATSGVEETRKRPSVERAISFNPKDRVEPVHGEESIGLGTSTFLEGAPASRTAIQRRESDNETSAFGSSLTRKRSLAQRIRGISQPRRGWEGVGAQRITSPDARYHYGGTTSPDSDPQATNGPQSAGGRYKTHETNPFFDDYDDAYEKKGASIKIAETENRQGGRARAPSSPMGRHDALERRITTDSIPEGQQQKSSGGFLSRITLHVLTTHLLASLTSHATVIDTTGAFDVLRLQRVAAQRLEAADGRPNNANVHVDVGPSVNQMLERVKIMRVFDFVGLVEAIGEVREELELGSAGQQAKKEPHGCDQDATRATVADSQDVEEMLMGDEPPTSPRDEAAEQQQQQQQQQQQRRQEQQTTTRQERYGMIIVDNITQVAAPIIKSNYIQGHALLTSLLRTLTHLTRTHALCTVLVNTAVVHRPSGSRSTARPHTDTANPNRTAIADAPPLPPHDPSNAAAPPPAGELPSVFAANTARPALGRSFPYLVDLHLFASAARSASSVPRRGDGTGGVREKGARDASEAGEGCVSVVEVLADRCDGRVGRWGGFVVRDGVELRGL
ncbi:hypothetical protein B0A49_02606 [Cryomyces minteri]|uniref:DNA recombination and repair protein Rad51-like C-terminal domain-containing protein n=1 Tax=Cryomyces minteri TaxID=331657 RepID=A0A4U0XJB9_9PEZI|nr:hypothetical protein B0A49_02606 [Cryomyces minteri]